LPEERRENCITWRFGARKVFPGKERSGQKRKTTGEWWGGEGGGKGGRAFQTLRPTQKFPDKGEKTRASAGKNLWKGIEVDPGSAKRLFRGQISKRALVEGGKPPGPAGGYKALGGRSPTMGKSAGGGGDRSSPGGAKRDLEL